MKSIAELRQQIEKEIAAISYPTSPNDLYSPIDYIMALGGKRMRPILLLLAHQLYNSNIQPALKAALAIEIFHNFTLLHDDIMDKAPLRRGQKTVHEKWNTNIAIWSVAKEHSNMERSKDGIPIHTKVVHNMEHSKKI